MNIKKCLLSGLFSLISGSAMMGVGTKSEAEVTSWLPPYPKVARDTNVPYTFVYKIAELCQAKAEGQDDLNWTSVNYIIAGTLNVTIDKTNGGKRMNGQTVPHGQPDAQPVTDDSGGIELGGLHSGSYDCLANASGTDAVTGAAWSGGTGDTWVTCP